MKSVLVMGAAEPQEDLFAYRLFGQHGEGGLGGVVVTQAHGGPSALASTMADFVAKKIAEFGVAYATDPLAMVTEVQAQMAELSKTPHYSVPRGHANVSVSGTIVMDHSHGLVVTHLGTTRLLMERDRKITSIMPKESAEGAPITGFVLQPAGSGHNFLPYPSTLLIERDEERYEDGIFAVTPSGLSHQRALWMLGKVGRGRRRWERLKAFAQSGSDKFSPSDRYVIIFFEP